jgi:hypothetical protein
VILGAGRWRRAPVISAGFCAGKADRGQRIARSRALAASSRRRKDVLWLASGPRACARGGAGPRAAGVREEWSRGAGREVEERKVDADEGGRGVSDGGGERRAR